MLRKRTSFKPNLKQVASQPNQTALPPQLAPDKELNAESVQVSDQVTAEIQQPDSSTANQSSDHNDSQSPVGNESQQTRALTVGLSVLEQVPQVSSERVREAITQLTGQRFEPIKSLSLRSSANKNVKLKDLLFFNPPMTKDQKRHKKSICSAKRSGQKTQDDNATKADEEAEEVQVSSAELSLVPKVKMGPEGKLVLDESSTVISRKNSIKEQEAIVEDNEDIISRTNYDSYRRRPASTSQSKWSLEDTKKFYHALTIMGTDFSMMESLLFSGSRSRTELHKKFKREERVNKLKIDFALSNRISLNSEELDDLREVFYG